MFELSVCSQSVRGLHWRVHRQLERLPEVLTILILDEVSCTRKEVRIITVPKSRSDPSDTFFWLHSWHALGVRRLKKV